MRGIVFGLLMVSTIASAQQPNTFENVEVTDAEEINGNVLSLILHIAALEAFPDDPSPLIENISFDPDALTILDSDTGVKEVTVSAEVKSSGASPVAIDAQTGAHLPSIGLSNGVYRWALEVDVGSVLSMPYAELANNLITRQIEVSAYDINGVASRLSKSINIFREDDVAPTFSVSSVLAYRGGEIKVEAFCEYNSVGSGLATLSLQHDFPGGISVLGPTGNTPPAANNPSNCDFSFFFDPFSFAGSTLVADVTITLIDEFGNVSIASGPFTISFAEDGDYYSGSWDWSVTAHPASSQQRP